MCLTAAGMLEQVSLWGLYFFLQEYFYISSDVSLLQAVIGEVKDPSV